MNDNARRRSGSAYVGTAVKLDDGTYQVTPALWFMPKPPDVHLSDKAVKDFTRVCEQTGLIDNLRKE